VPPLCGRLEVGAKSPVANDEKSAPAVEPTCGCEVIESPSRAWLEMAGKGGEQSASWPGIEWALAGDDGCVVRRATKA